MTKWTKADIDELVEAAPLAQSPHPEDRITWVETVKDGELVDLDDLRATLYLAAGLTAEGEPKPEKVRAWVVRDKMGNLLGIWKDVGVARAAIGMHHTITPGTFIPDGAE